MCSHAAGIVGTGLHRPRRLGWSSLPLRSPVLLAVRGSWPHPPAGACVTGVLLAVSRSASSVGTLALNTLAPPRLHPTPCFQIRSRLQAREVGVWRHLRDSLGSPAAPPCHWWVVGDQPHTHVLRRHGEPELLPPRVWRGCRREASSWETSSVAASASVAGIWGVAAVGVRAGAARHHGDGTGLTHGVLTCPVLLLRVTCSLPSTSPRRGRGPGPDACPLLHPSRPEGLRRLVKLGSQGRRTPWDGRLRASVRFASLWILSFVLLSPQVGFEVHTLMPEQGTERAHGRSCFFIATGPTALLCTGSEPAPQAPSCRPELKLARQL